MSSAAAVRSAATESTSSAGMRERPASPQTKTVTPAAASGALCVVVTVDVTPASCRSTRCATSALPAHGGHLGDRAEAGPQHADEVRAEVPEGALLPPPRRVERVVRLQRGAEPDRGAAGPALAGPAAAGLLVGEPGADLGVEPPGEEDDRRDLGLLDGGDQLVRVVDGQRDRLLEQQVLARLRGRGPPAAPGRAAAPRTRPRPRCRGTRRSPAWAVAPCSAASAAAAAWSRPQTAASSAPGVLARAGACVIFAQ